MKAYRVMAARLAAASKGDKYPDTPAWRAGADDDAVGVFMG